MKNLKDIEFLNGVWSKVRYLEYLKKIKEQIELRKRKTFIKTLIFSSCVFVMICLIILLWYYSIISVNLAGIVAMTIGVLYQYLREKVSI